MNSPEKIALDPETQRTTHYADFKQALEPEQISLFDDQFIAEVRAQMLKFCRIHLGDTPYVEDVVQEALIGALKNISSFNGKSALRTWMFAILKNKIMDAIRLKQSQRDGQNTSFQSDDEYATLMFNNKGMWNRDERPLGWGDPEQAFKQDQFWIVFEICLNNLPVEQSRAFMMREFIGLETEEICAECNISQSNLYVLLHRARLKLQKCLEIRWFFGEHNEKL